MFRRMSEYGSAELGQVERRLDFEICSWGKGVIRSGRSGCI